MVGKRIAMVLTTMALITGIVLDGHITVEASNTEKVQMMEINCPHCHENTTINVMMSDVECIHCNGNIHIDG